jgi:hypothetical protein
MFVVLLQLAEGAAGWQPEDNISLMFLSFHVLLI